jgi:eukaryotic-like serine/threonine-protein kinase
MATALALPPRITTASQFAAALRASRLLSADTIVAFENEWVDGALDGRACAQQLIVRGLLTTYQAEQLLAGQTEHLVLGQYRILDRLGAGGMGHVYRAEHATMKRVVAVKVLAEHVLREPAAAERFHREIQIAAQLTHPNIVAAYDAAEIDGVYFLAMEYVDGTDLGGLVEELGPLPVRLACEYIRQAALGLQYAHEHGLVHCDIKPANLLVRRDVWSSKSRPSLSWCDGMPEPVVKILDLGVARFVDGAQKRIEGEHQPDLEGTPDYLAPERAHDAAAADIRSDLYSLGCTFYYLLTGHVPYPGGTWSEKLVRHHFETATPLHEFRADVPADVMGIVYRLMAKHPAERFQCPAEAAKALEQWLADQPTELDGSSHACPAAGCASRTAVQVSSVPTPVDASAESEGVQAGFCPGIRVIEVTKNSVSGAETGLGIRRFIPWAAGVAAAAAGLLMAWGLRSPALRPVESPSPNPVLAVPPASFLTIAGRPDQRVTDFGQALSQARDGDSIVLHGAGPFASGPLVIKNKSLTVQAADGIRPQILLHRSPEDSAWQALLATDRPLTITGVDIRYASREPNRAGPETTHLIYSENASLRLVDCHLDSPDGQALVVCRRSPSVDIEDCSFHARALAVCIEVEGHSPPTVRLTGNSVFLSEPRAAAFSLWAAEPSEHGRVRLEMKDNSVHGGRALALTGIDPGAQTALAYPSQSAFRRPAE